MQNFLLLGAAGFIGSNFVHYVERLHNIDATVVDKLTYAGRLANIEDHLNRRNWPFIQADICDKDKMEEIIRSQHFDVIVNFAAASHVSRSVTDPGEFTMTNVMGVQTVMECVRKFSPKSFVVHISTDEVFGQLSEWQAPWGDFAPLNPRSPYAATKASGELIARSYFTTYGIDVVVVRPSNCFGPYQYPEKLIPRAVTNILEGKKVPMMGEGKEMRDWLYVHDLCAMLHSIIDHRPSGECFNIPGNAIHRNKELIEKMLRIMDRPWEENVEKIPSRLAHDFKYHVAGEGIARLKQYHSISMPFDIKLITTIEWYEKNIDWWKPVKEEAERGNQGADTGVAK